MSEEKKKRLKEYQKCYREPNKSKYNNNNNNNNKTVFLIVILIVF